MRKWAAGVPTLETEGFSPWSGLPHRVHASLHQEPTSAQQKTEESRTESWRTRGGGQTACTRSRKMACKLQAKTRAPPRNRKRSILPVSPLYHPRDELPQVGPLLPRAQNCWAELVKLLASQIDTVSQSLNQSCGKKNRNKPYEKRNYFKSANNWHRG